MRLGLLEKDDRWDPVAGALTHVTSIIDPWVQVYGDSGTLAIEGANTYQSGRHAVRADSIGRMNSGGSLKVDTGVTKLESIKVWLSRSSSRSTAQIILRLYDVVSDADPRPTGGIIASSDTVQRAAVPRNSVGTWITFNFSGEEQISLSAGQRFAYNFTTGTSETGMWTNIQAHYDAGYSSGSGLAPSGAVTNDIHMVTWSTGLANGFQAVTYAHSQDYPHPTLLDDNTVVPDVVFQDNFTPSFPLTDFATNVPQEWGDSGYAADGIRALGALVEDWVAEPGYDPSGSPIALVWEIAAAEVDDEYNVFSTEGGAPPELWIEYQIEPPVAATVPVPANGAIEVSELQVLSWTSGARTESFDVYFGTNEILGAGDLQGNQVETVFDPGLMVKGQTYYWRIDSFNEDGETTGTVWSFTVEDLPARPIGGGDVTQELSVGGGDVTQELSVGGGDVTQEISVGGGDVTQELSVSGGDVTQELSVGGGDLTVGDES
jgi:hypothetical protein